VFAATSFPPTVADVFEVTTGTPRPFARVTAAGWLGPLHATRDGRLLAATNALGGSLWDLTPGGDRTTATPLARNLFGASLAFLEGMALDEDGNAYVSNGDGGRQRVVRVSPAGVVSALAGTYDNATGLWVCGRTLLIAEGNTGRVLAHDLTSGAEAPHARGFRASPTHLSGQLAVDHRGRVLVLWSNALGTGLFDITAGGDLSAARPLVPYTAGIDVNQIAIDADNNVYVAGDGTSNLYVSRFTAGVFAPFVVFARGLGDTESVAIGP
jgi:outer membrane protein assembly factor BamB